LNVAVTRARQELVVYSSITADKIDMGRTKVIGVHHLNILLDFAERGAVALSAVENGSVDGFDSPFEEACRRTRCEGLDRHSANRRLWLSD